MEPAYMRSLMAEVYWLLCGESNGSKEYPKIVWPTVSRAARAIQSAMSITESSFRDASVSMTSASYRRIESQLSIQRSKR